MADRASKSRPPPPPPLAQGLDPPLLVKGNREPDSHRGQKIFSLPRVVPCFPLLGLTPSGLSMGLSSTLIYTSELILCSTKRARSLVCFDAHAHAPQT